jgi:hypothetical protein
MSTTAVSNVSIFQELQNFYHDRRTDLRQLGSALQSGDLNAAQQAYDALVSLGQGGPFGNSEPFSRTDRATDFEAVGQALQSGDLAGAQTAFATLQETFGHHHSDGGHHLPAFMVNLGSADAAQSASDTESIYQQLQDFRAQRKTGLEQLGQALQSGDVNAAQQAFDALVRLGQNGPFRSSTPFRRADREQDFEAIGQALQNGDLAGAQQAFATLADTFGHHAAQVGFGMLPPIIINVFGGPGPSSGGNTPPQPEPPTLPPTPAPVGPPTPVPPPQEPPSTAGGPVGPPEIIINVGGSTAPSGNTPEIIVSLMNASSTPEEVMINFGDHGSSGQLTIDVNQGQNGNPREEISITFNQASFNYQLVLNLFDSALNSPAQSNSLSLNA